MSSNIKKIPEGSHTITPSFMFKDCKKAIEFYKKAFNAKVMSVFPTLDGKGIMHAQIQIGDSFMMMGDEMEKCKSAETLGSSPVSFFMYVNDVDASFKQAVDAGCTVFMPVAQMFWGDRAGSLSDPFGYSWMIATHTQDLTHEEIRKNAEVFFAQMGKGK